MREWGQTYQVDHECGSPEKLDGFPLSLLFPKEKEGPSLTKLNAWPIWENKIIITVVTRAALVLFRDTIVFIIAYISGLGFPGGSVHSIPFHFSSLIPKMLMLTLAISCLTTFILLWFMNLTFQVHMQYCYSIGLYLHHHSHPQLGVIFTLAPSLQSFWSYFSTLLQ